MKSITPTWTSCGLVVLPPYLELNYVTTKKRRSDYVNSHLKLKTRGDNLTKFYVTIHDNNREHLMVFHLEIDYSTLGILLGVVRIDVYKMASGHNTYHEGYQ